MNILEEYRQKKLGKEIRVEGDVIVINLTTSYRDESGLPASSGGVRIPLAECRTAEGILKWAMRLSDRARLGLWLDTERVRCFITIATQAANIKLD